MNPKIDLHIHSTFSDGYFSPRDVVLLARERSVEIISLTDHDSTDGLAAARVEAENAGICFVDGVEINTVLDREEVHILGYGIHPQDQELQRTLRQLREGREKRMDKILAKLSALDIVITRQDVLAQTQGKASIGRPHIARAMSTAGYAADERDAFSRYLSPGCPAFVPRYKVNPQQAIATVRAAGGLAFLAHPGLLLQDEKTINQLDLDGLEVYHTDHTPAQTKKYLEYANSRGLLISGGSDCHGQPDNVLLGTVEICYKHLQPWLKGYWTEPIS